MKNFLFVLLGLVLFHTTNAQLPEFQWAKIFLAYNQGNPTVLSNGRSVAVDKDGNVYTAGLLSHTADMDPGPGVFALTADNWANTAIYISKLSPAGDFLWAIQIPTYVSFGNIEIRVDKDNNVYIASELRLPTDFDPGPNVFTLSPKGAVDAFVAKYDSNGNLVWAKNFGGPGDTVPRSDVLDVDQDNNVIICGNFNSTVDFDPGPGTFNITSTAHIQSFIVKLDVNGNLLWAKQYGHSNLVYSGSRIADIKTDQQGSIYVTGDFTGNCDFDPGAGNFMMAAKGMRNPYVGKLDANGNFVWAKSILNSTSTYSDFTDTRGIDVDSENNVYIVGNFFGSFDFDPGPNAFVMSGQQHDWYLVKLNSQGNLAWADAFGGGEADYGADVAVDLEGNVYAIGTIGKKADMDPGTGSFMITTVHENEASAIVKVNAMGDFITAASFDQIGSNWGNCLTRRMVVDDQFNIYITGYTAGVIDFDPGPSTYPLSSEGHQAPYVLKLARCSAVSRSTLTINACSSYTLNNRIFDSTGTYTVVVPNKAGCDSIITLHLTLNKKSTSQYKTICEGESFFAGKANQTSSGTYIDTLISHLSCDSIVTTYLTVNKKPVPMLGPDKDLCEGTQLVLDPGNNFTQYLWQDASVRDSFVADRPGTYWVTVKNAFNCMATDTVTVRKMLPLPDRFLKSSDSICAYQQLIITPARLFTQYQWSTGATTGRITTERPGNYWLKVKDENGCEGIDTISVYQKECMTGVYFPNAFTPNKDGRNDFFKAIVFGRIKSFLLQVYSREGQLIFQTNDPLIGWDGKHNGKEYSSSVFAWKCTYQLENQEPEFRKGTVTVIH